MADDNCGSSNPLKGLGALADRDRSLQQDRAGVSAHPAAGSTFRSNPVAPSGDGEVHAFLNDALQADATAAPGSPPLRQYFPPGSFQEYQRFVNDGVHPTDATPAPGSSFFPPGSYQEYQRFLQEEARLERQARRLEQVQHSLSGVGGARNMGWVNQFTATNGVRGNAAVPAMYPVMGTNTQTAGPAFYPAPMNTAYNQAAGQPGYAPPGHGLPVDTRAHMPVGYPGLSSSTAPYNATPASHPQSTLAANRPAGMTEAELNARFDQYDTEFGEFENEMHRWMDQHGPSRVEREDAALNVEMERIADELDRQRLKDQPNVANTVRSINKNSSVNSDAQEKKEDNVKNDDDLSKTALEILESVADNTTDKFRQSSFLQLMRRITAGDVILRGDDFVESATGQPVATIQHEQQGKWKENQSAASSSTGTASAADKKGKGKMPGAGIDKTEGGQSSAEQKQL